MNAESNINFANSQDTSNKGFRPLRVLAILVAVIVVSVVVLFFLKGYNFGKSDSAIDFDDYMDFGASWYYFDEAKTVHVSHLDQLGVINKKSFTLYKTLPNEVNLYNTMFFLSELQAVRVSINDDVIFDYAMEDLSDPQNIIGNNYCVVHIPANSAGKTLSVQLVGVNNKVKIPDISIGSSGSALSLFLQQRASSFAIVGALFAFSIALLIMFTSQRRLDSESSMTTLYLSFHIFLTAIWMLADSQLLQLLLKNGRLIELIKYYTFMVMPIPYFLFLKGVTQRGARAFYLLSILHILNVFLISFLYLTGIMGLENSLAITIVIMTVSVLILLSILYRNFKRAPQAKVVFAGSLLFFLIIALLCAGYRYGKGYALLCRASLSAYLVFLSFIAWNKNQKLTSEHVHFNLYKRMAYTDAMTGVGNRAAYDQRLMELGSGNISFSRIAIIIADINGTKAINDNYGNEVGDRLIVALAMCMQSASGGVGECFRIGGDEFALIFVDEVPENVLQKLENAIERYNQQSTFKLSAACGYIDEKVTHISPMFMRLLQKKAEDTMYQIKQSIHENTRKKTLFEVTTVKEYKDSLTGILNYYGFKHKATELLANKNDNKKRYVLDFDINRFENLDCFFGSEISDDLLRKVASHLSNICGENDICAHTESDHFVALLSFDNVQAAMKAIKALDKKLKNLIQGFNLLLSYGLYEIDDYSEDISTMLDKARTAKRTIKGNYENNIAIYSNEIHQRMMEELRLSSSMEHALQNKEFIAYYQPKYDCKTEKVVGAEALVRWKKPNGELLLPERFISLFERNKLIIKLDWFMFETVCEFLRKQIDLGNPCVPISVNFSRVHNFGPEFVYRLISTAAKYDIPRRLLEIELTESAFVFNHDSIVSCMNSIREAGFLVSIDDFGTGLSTLALLKDVQCDIIKIDKSLLKSNKSPLVLDTILECVFYYAKKHKLLTIAEGVETKEQFELVRSAGCDIVQGYYFDMPMSEEEFVQKLKRRNIQKLPVFKGAAVQLGVTKDKS